MNDTQIYYKEIKEEIGLHQERIDHLKFEIIKLQKKLDNLIKFINPGSNEGEDFESFIKGK